MPTYNSINLVPGRDGKPVVDGRQLTGHGPLLSCEIRVDDRRAAVLQSRGVTIPSAIHGKFLVDTGATRTSIDDSVLVGLGVDPVGDTSVRTPSGSARYGVYPCGLAFPGSALPSIRRIFVVGCDLKEQDIVGLLGRDFLSQFLLVYNGPTGTWTLAI